MPHPTEHQLKTLGDILAWEQTGTRYINRQTADECERFGWAELQRGGGYRLTAAGREMLADD